jgi:hypothetical protein
MHTDVLAYNGIQPEPLATICAELMQTFTAELEGSTHKLFHGSPAWFLEGNPIVGYFVPVKKDRVQVMFWSGQSFDEPGLTAEGSFKAAVKNYESFEDIDIDELKTWISKSKSIQWDYKNIVKNRGKLDRLV